MKIYLEYLDAVNMKSKADIFIWNIWTQLKWEAKFTPKKMPLMALNHQCINLIWIGSNYVTVQLWFAFVNRHNHLIKRLWNILNAFSDTMFFLCIILYYPIKFGIKIDWLVHQARIFPWGILQVIFTEWQNAWSDVNNTFNLSFLFLHPFCNFPFVQQMHFPCGLNGSLWLIILPALCHSTTHYCWVYFQS